jgi:hypothetical protein
MTLSQAFVSVGSEAAEDPQIKEIAPNWMTQIRNPKYEAA